MARRTYRVYLNPKVDAQLMAYLETLPNKAAYIHRALEGYAQVVDPQGGDAKQYQVHVTDPELQEFLESVGDGYVGAALRRALWLQMGRSLGIDVEGLADKIVQNLLATGWAPSEAPETEEVPPEMEEFIGQF
jgi:hypothetical protein